MKTHERFSLLKQECVINADMQNRLILMKTKNIR